MRCWLVILMLCSSLGVNAQTLKGIVTDGVSGRPLQSVTVVNMRSQHSAYTNEDGEFAITAAGGEQVAFSYMGYKAVQRAAPPTLNISSIRVEMFPLHVEMDEVLIRAGPTKYQRDSAERKAIYARVLAQRRPGITSPVSFIADRLSKKSKMVYNFQKSYNYWEGQIFIDSRYTPEIVSKLTGLTGDSLGHFMNAHPMPTDYARSATDLELKMWIRNNYKQWMKREKEADTTGIK